MSDYPPPSNNPLPYPDRRRPAKQQQQYGASGSSQPAGPAGGNPPTYPFRPPAKYSDYVDQPFSSPQYQSESSSHQQPTKQNSPPPSSKKKPSPPPPGAPWPTPPTAYNSGDDNYGRQDSSGGRVDKPQADYASNNPYAMATISSALPLQSATTYEYDFNRPHRPPEGAPPVPDKIPLSGPPAGGYGPHQSQAYPASPVGEYGGNQQNYLPPQSSDYYQGPPSQVKPASPQSYSPQSPQSPVPAGPQGSGYGPQSYNAQSPTSPHEQPHAAQYAQYVAPAVAATAFQAPPPTQSGYGGSPAQTQTYPPQASPIASPQQVPPQANPPFGALNAPSSQPVQQPPAATPAPPAPPAGVLYAQSNQPVQQHPTAAPSQPAPPAAQPAPSQSEYMNAPPPIPGTAHAFPPPPPTYRPTQTSPTDQITTSPGGSQPTVKIYGKDYPIPAYTQTIQTPSQCDPALKEAYFGPYLRFKNVDLQQNLWLGTVLLILPIANPLPQLEFHPSGDFSQLRPAPVYQIYTFADYQFLRYELVIPIGPGEQKWTYAVTTQTTQTWEFSVAGREQQWRFIAWSCNGFSAGVKKEEIDKLGFETMWKNVIERFAQEGGFHAQLGGGDQIYADRMWKEIPFLIEWLGVKGKDQRQYWPWKSEHDNIMRHTYFYYYTESFAKPFLRDAMAKIPHVFQIDDHDIFDGYGSYTHHLQQSNVFQGIGRVAIEFYLIFQHHTTQQWLSQNPNPMDLVSATGSGWSFIKYFGPTTAIVGLDTRCERDRHRIMSQQSHDLMFNNLRMMPTTISHCVVMLAIPIVYPRLASVEKALAGVAVAKKGVNGAFNILGKAITSVTPAGNVTQNTHSAFEGVKKAFGKSGLMSSVVSQFGEVDLLDDLQDHWTHASHDHERTIVIRTFQDIALTRKVRVTFVSGDVHCCGVGYLYDPKAPQDHKLMYQIITSAIVNVPPPGVVIKLLHNNEKYWVPPLNSNQSTKVQSDTKEEMMELFAKDVDGKLLTSTKKLLARRNYAICRGGEGGSEVWELCVEKGRGSETVKYGPIAIPRLQ